MTLRIVRLGSPREPAEGVRLGTVRHPPRGVPKEQIAARGFYDAWLPALAPSPQLLKRTRAAVDDDRSWACFARRFRSEMKQPHARQILEMLAALSHDANFSLGCYCADESRCHRSLLRTLLAERGAKLAE